MKYLMSLVIIIFLSNCRGKSKESYQEGDFKIEFLFEKNGCKMYRFKDGSRMVYWSDCQGRVQADFTQKQGKNNVTYHSESITSN